jgi:hypothetical protein
MNLWSDTVALASVGTRALTAGQYYILFTLDVYALS